MDRILYEIKYLLQQILATNLSETSEIVIDILI